MTETQNDVIDFDAIVAKDTWTADDHRDLLEGLFSQNDAPDKWRRILGEMEADHPEPKGTAALKIGIGRYMLCRLPDALDALTAATDNKDRRYFQGMCLKGLGQYAAAIEDFERAKARGWEGPAPDVQIIECLALDRQVDQARKALRTLDRLANRTDFGGANSCQHATRKIAGFFDPADHTTFRCRSRITVLARGLGKRLGNRTTR